MKNSFTLFILSLIFAVMAFGQQWTKFNNLPLGYYVDVHFVDSTTGMLATATGQVFATSNGGGAWDTISPSTQPVSTSAISMRADEELWLVGMAEMLLSTNWGEDWEIVPNPRPQANYTDILVNNNLTWFVAYDSLGSYVMNTTDRLSWLVIPFDTIAPRKLATGFNRVWSYGDGTGVISTTNGGIAWRVNNIDFTSANFKVHGLNFSGNGIMYATTTMGDQSYLYCSSDSGTTWNKQLAPGMAKASSYFSGKVYLSTFDVVPKVMTTSDCGLTWTSSLLPDSTITSFSSPDSLKLWAVGSSGVYQYKPRAINHPPILQNPGLNLTMTINKTRRDTLVATDEDGDVVKYHQYLSNLSWITTDSLTGIRVFSPTTNDTGRHLILFQAYDSYGGTDQVLDTIQVYLNRPPVITSSSKTDTLQLNATYRDTLYYSDLDDDICTWTVPEKPSGMIASVNNQTLQLYWVANTVGTFNVRALVDDNHGGTDTWLKTLVVVQTNRAPAIDTTHLPRTARVGQDYSGHFGWSDPDGDRVFFTLTTAPSWLSITDSGHLYNNRSLYQSDVGQRLVTIHYTDNHGASGNFSYWLAVGIFYPPVLDDVTDSLAIPGQLYQTQPRLISMGNGKIQWYFIYNDEHPLFLSININTGLISGTPNTQNIGRYLVILQVVDSLGLTDQVQYWLRVPSPNGINDGNGTPTQFALHQNYPNPFNPTTTISFSLPIETQVTLKVYNMVGQEVAVLMDQENPIGNYSVQWNPEGLPSGIYRYRLVAGEFTETKKMLLIK